MDLYCRSLHELYTGFYRFTSSETNKSLREVRSSVCKVANRYAKFGNRFAKLQIVTRSSEIGLQSCKSLREVRRLVCKVANRYAKFGNRFAKLQIVTRSSEIGLHIAWDTHICDLLARNILIQDNLFFSFAGEPFFENPNY